MGKSITTASSAIILTAANCTTYNPLSIATTGGITNSFGSAIYSNTAEPWIINNAGTGAEGFGVSLPNGGTAVSLDAASRVIFDGGAVFTGVVAANTNERCERSASLR
jgi:hypothetical protein